MNLDIILELEEVAAVEKAIDRIDELETELRRALRELTEAMHHMKYRISSDGPVRPPDQD